MKTPLRKQGTRKKLSISRGMWKRKRWEGEGVEGGKAGKREEGKKKKATRSF